MAVFNSPEVYFDLIIYEELSSRVIRTGLLLFYDPLFLTDMYPYTLEELNYISLALPPSYDPSIFDLPNGINAILFEIETGAETIYPALPGVD